MSAAGSDELSPRPWQRRLMVGITVVVALHSAVLALWLSPANPLRNTVGNATLASYVDPYFEQSWGSLDPSTQYVDESFRIRAHVQDANGKKTHVTPWVDLTKAESGPLRHDIDPARVHVIARRLATNLNAAMFALNARQRRLVAANYITTPLATLERRLLRAGSDPAAVQNYVSYDRMATEFASMYADAAWSDDTTLEVQYLVGRRTVPAYGDRKATSLKDVDYLWFVFGYRKALQGSYEAQSVFNSYVKK